MLSRYQFHTGKLNLSYVKGLDHGPPLLMIHGVAARWQGLLPIIPMLCLRNTVYAVDLRGHGESDRAERYRIPDYASDLVPFIQQVIGEPVTLLGSSLGGMVALYLSAHHPSLVKATIVTEPPFLKTSWISSG